MNVFVRGAITPTGYSADFVRAPGDALITVHHLNNSRSQRVLWLLEELGLPYEIKPYQRDPKTLLAPPALRGVHPLGKSPVIVDGDICLAESGAILTYLIERHGNGRLTPPANSAEWVRHIYWMHYAEGSAMPPLLLKLIFDRLPKARMPFFVRLVARKICERTLQSYVEPQIAQHLDYMEGELNKHAWFAGDEFTVADIQMSYPVEAAVARGGLNASRPRLMTYLERIHARPAYRRALKNGGPFSIPD